jgi:integrase
MQSETLVVIDGKSTASSLRNPRGVFQKVPGKYSAWWIRYTDGSGRYHREKAGTFAMAKQLLNKRKTQALQGKKLPETLRRAPVLFSTLAEDAMVYSKAHKRSSRSDEIIKKNLVNWFGNEDTETLFGAEIEARLAIEGKGREWAPSTYNHYRAFLMLMYREGRFNRKVQNNPARDIRHKHEDNSRYRFLSRGADGEDARLTKVIRREYPEHLSEYIFAKGTGLRLGSQYSATYEMIDWEAKVLNIPRTKNGEPVHMPLNKDVLAAIRALPSWVRRSGPIFCNLNHPERPVLSNDHWFKPALEKAGIADFKWHDLRHTFASWLVQDGVPLDRVAKLLNHKSLAMTVRYAHLAPNQLHEDVARLNSKPISTPVAPQPVSSSAPAEHIN